MTDKVPMPVDGDGKSKGQPDGVNDPGRGSGGDSAGGNYQNPHEGKDGDSDADGFFGHGGQTDIAYHGDGQLGAEGSGTANATTEGGGDIGGDGDAGPRPRPTGPDQDLSAEYHRDIEVDGRRMEIVDTSGIAAAEAAGTVGAEGQARTNEHPGSG